MAHVVSYRNEFCIPWSLSTSDIVSWSYVGETTQNPLPNTRPLDPLFPQILKIEEIGRSAEQEISRRVLSGSGSHNHELRYADDKTQKRLAQSKYECALNGAMKRLLIS